MMKKYALLISIISISICSLAQINQGNFLVGSKLKISREVDKIVDYTDKKIIIYIDPSVEVAVVKNLTVGTDINFDYQHSYSISKNSYNSDLSSKIRQTGVTPFLRYYFVYKNSYFYPHFKYGFISLKYTSTSGNVSNASLQIPTVGFGYMHMFNNFGLFAELNQQWLGSKTSGEMEFDRNELLMEFGFKFKIGKE